VNGKDLDVGSNPGFILKLDGKIDHLMAEKVAKIKAAKWG